VDLGTDRGIGLQMLDPHRVVGARVVQMDPPTVDPVHPLRLETR
jgi:hypothetical protein